ncbi:DUF4097 family beta strand repeat-containing protein [Streptomyces sp. NPDC051784]|uniref:DUF4097 family beta strand repeat-containing protein n=1 Tax=Streptomyces sp. NPDC051784 TaxID=3155805 RepID=UPI003412FEB7
MQNFDTPTAVNAVLDIPAGRIRFIASDRTDTTVEVRPADPSSSRDAKAAEQTEVTYSGGVLDIKAPEAKSRILGHSGSVEVTVQLPTGSRVEAKSAAAEFRGVGQLGDVTVEGGHGSVKLDEATSVHLTGLDAHITVGRLHGSGEISTMSGDVTVTEASHGQLTLSAQRGDITLGVAKGVSASLDAGTSYGRVDNALMNTGGTPALTIKATTQQGDITARTL